MLQITITQCDPHHYSLISQLERIIYDKLMQLTMFHNTEDDVLVQKLLKFEGYYFSGTGVVPIIKFCPGLSRCPLRRFQSDLFSLFPLTLSSL